MTLETSSDKTWKADDRQGWHMAQNLTEKSKKLIGMPSLTHRHVDTKDRKLETKPIVISDILRIVLYWLQPFYCLSLSVFKCSYSPVFLATHSDLGHSDHGLLIQEKHCSSPHLGKNQILQGASKKVLGAFTIFRAYWEINKLNTDLLFSAGLLDLRADWQNSRGTSWLLFLSENCITHPTL